MQFKAALEIEVKIWRRKNSTMYMYISTVYDNLAIKAGDTTEMLTPCLTVTLHCPHPPSWNSPQRSFFSSSFFNKMGYTFLIHGYCCVMDFCYRIHLQILFFLQVNIESHATYYRFSNIVLNLSNLAIWFFLLQILFSILSIYLR